MNNELEEETTSRPVSSESELRAAFEEWYRKVFDWPTWPIIRRVDDIADGDKKRQARLLGLRPGEYQSLDAECAWHGFCAGYALGKRA